MRHPGIRATVCGVATTIFFKPRLGGETLVIEEVGDSPLGMPRLVTVRLFYIYGRVLAVKSRDPAAPGLYMAAYAVWS